MEGLIQQLDQMKSSPIRNYVIAGLDSFLISNGKVRYFENSRQHQDSITPHSHRFDFSCIVLAGSVRNRVWSECRESEGDFFQSSTLKYAGEVGEHSVTPEGRGFWKYKETIYDVGDCYSMDSSEVHSIIFSRGAKVLFFEGENKSNESVIIEPVVRGEVIRTYQKLEYMFKRDEQM